MGLRRAAVLSQPLNRSSGTKVGARKVSGKKAKLAPWVAAALPLPGEGHRDMGQGDAFVMAGVGQRGAVGVDDGRLTEHLTGAPLTQ